MIVDKRLHLGLLARLNLPILSLLVAYDIVVTTAYCGFGWRFVSLPNLPLALLGSAIALFVSIRNNAAYGRWWEARTLWGAMVNSSRSLARGLAALTSDADLQHRLVRYQIAYVLTLRRHLLRQSSAAVLERWLPPELAADCRRAANAPMAIQMAIGRELAAARKTGALDLVATAALDAMLTDITNAQGGLERIKNTPLPRQYSLLPQIFIRAYCAVLPLGVVANLGLATPLGSGLIGFMFLILDEVGRDLEDPFENRVFDVPMDAITRTIEIDLLQAIGSAEVPPPITAKDGILM
jgi:ion channel-forming bestrophin family protein